MPPTDGPQGEAVGRATPAGVLPLLRPLLEADRPEPPGGRSVVELRVAASQRQARLRSEFYLPGPVPAAVEDIEIPVAGASMRVRIYRPDSAGPLGAHLYLHGGGFWLGSIEGSDTACRELSAAAASVVVSVGYRLAPEHPFPVPPEDCYAALVWVVGHAAELGVDPRAVSVGGESAGGNLAAVVSLLAKERGGPTIALQILSIPVTDLTMSQPSVEAFADGYLLSRAGMHRQRELYVGIATDPRHPLVSPLFAPELTGLPPAVVATMEFDPHRDEGEAYARRLVEAGVPTLQRRYLGHVHGSAMFTALLPESRGYYVFLGDALRAAYASAVARPGASR